MLLVTAISILAGSDILTVLLEYINASIIGEISSIIEEISRICITKITKYLEDTTSVHS